MNLQWICTLLFVLCPMGILLACDVDSLEKPQPAMVGSRLNLMAITDLGSKGRVQDEYTPQVPVLAAIYQDPKAAVPKLIASITDARETPSPVICPIVDYTAVGDIALFILSDMFTDASWTKQTVPGTDLETLIGSTDPHQAFLPQLHAYIRKHGRALLRQKWTRIWKDNESRIYWDSTDRCFKVTSKDH